MPKPIRDLLITAAETNSHHGVGILLQRYFADSSEFVCLRTTSLYNGEEPFGAAHHELCSRNLTWRETEAHLRQILSLYEIRRILCVPYYREEFVHAVYAKAITGAPLCVYLMDDQNVFVPNVPDHWVEKALATADLALGISPELCAAYRHKYQRAIHLLPPVLTDAEPLVPCYWEPVAEQPLRAALIGNVWTANRFEQLRELLRRTGLHLDWFGHGSKARWLPESPEAWEADNLFCMGYLPEDDLIASLASYPFLIVPSGTLDATDDNLAFSRLSLPSRLIFLHARTDTPVLVFGSDESAAGRFVSRTGTGTCTSAHVEDFAANVKQLTENPSRAIYRSNIRKLAASLVFPAAGAWIWQSLSAQRPMAAPFDRAFSDQTLDAIVPQWRIAPPRNPPEIRLPSKSQPFAWEHAQSLAFLRLRHLEVLNDFGLEASETSKLELSAVNAAAAAHAVSGLLSGRGDVLFLGAELPSVMLRLPEGIRIWRFKDIGAWQRAGYAGAPEHLADARTGFAYPPQFPQFDAIVSTGWCGELNDDRHVLEGLSLYLDGCTRQAGFNLHLFTGVLHPSYFWVGPAYPYLKNRFLQAREWPVIDDLLAAEDAFVMGEEPYNRFWRQFTGRDYQTFGKPISLGLAWRKP
jgi:hypothetical protein